MEEVKEIDQKKLLELKFAELKEKAEYLTGDDSLMKKAFDKRKKEINIEKLERLVLEKEKEFEESKKDFVYPSDMRESWERMKSDGLHLTPIPGIKRRFLNLEARARSGTDKFWKIDDPKHRVKIGDLVSGFVPLDMAKEKKRRERERDTSDDKKEMEYRRQISEKVYRDSGGEINLMIDGYNPSKSTPKRKSYFYSK